MTTIFRIYGINLVVFVRVLALYRFFFGVPTLTLEMSSLPERAMRA